MSDWPKTASPVLEGAEGELVAVRITVEPRFLECALDVLANLNFPINPQIYHLPKSVIEFPAWAGRLPALRDALKRSGFEDACLTWRGMLDFIHSSAVRAGELRATA